MKPFVLIAEARLETGAVLAFYEHDGDYHLKLNGQTILNSKATLAEETFADILTGFFAPYHKPRVLIDGMGLGFVLKKVYKNLNVQSKIELTEPCKELLKWNREFLQHLNGKLLADARLKIHTRDTMEVIRKAPPDHYDVIMLDVNHGPAAMLGLSGEDFLTRQGVALIMCALKPGGRVGFWSAGPDRELEKMLKKAGHQVISASAKSYEQAKKASHTIYVVEKPLPKEKRRSAQVVEDAAPEGNRVRRGRRPRE